MKELYSSELIFPEREKAKRESRRDEASFI